ncbi:hypothetical protein NKJ09_15490 [Mesorhizobium sp. M0189]|uniref:hypothetical protein n=1 Tax=unclassified Mesorhizobium TaxID=325217 RepID=UPI003339A260
MSSNADLIVTNARVLTMDEGNPTAEAVAIKDGNILAVGDRRTIEALKGPATKVIGSALRQAASPSRTLPPPKSLPIAT